jgi:hypothetical protein
VDPRPGKLSFSNGYPSQETTVRLYDELDLQRAVQPYLWALPAVSVKVAFDGMGSAYGSSLATAAILENFLKAKTVVAAGNG